MSNLVIRGWLGADTVRGFAHCNLGMSSNISSFPRCEMGAACISQCCHLQAFLTYTLFILGTRSDSPCDVPLFAIPDIRRPRAVQYRLWLADRCASLRWWMVGYALLHLVLDTDVSTGLGSLLPGAPPPPVLPTLHSVALLLLAALALGDRLQCSARWFVGTPLSQAEAAWMWPKAQAGEHPHQVRPPAPLQLYPRREHETEAEEPPLETDGTPPRARHAKRAVDQLKAYTSSKAKRGRGVQPPPAPPSLPPHAALRMVCITIGTRGDVEPFVALGRAMKERGHSFAICSTDNFQDFVVGAGLEFIPLGLPRIEQPSAWLDVGSLGEMIEVTFKSFHLAYHKVAIGFYRAVLGDERPVFRQSSVGRSAPQWLKDVVSASTAAGCAGLELEEVVRQEDMGLGTSMQEGGMGGALDADAAAVMKEAAEADFNVTKGDVLTGSKGIDQCAGSAGGSDGLAVVPGGGNRGAARKADVILGTAHTVSFALDISESTGVPTWIAKLGPDVPSAAYAPPGKNASDVGILNKMAHYAFWLRVALSTRVVPIEAMEIAFRRAVLGLRDGRFAASHRISDMLHVPQFLPISPVLFPKPLDMPQWAFQTGFWMNFNVMGNGDSSDEEEGTHAAAAPSWKAPDWLTDFIHRRRSGPILCITFGSMVLATTNGTVSKLVRAALAEGCRVLLMHGWAEPPADLQDVLPEPEGLDGFASAAEAAKEPHAGATREVAVIRAAPHDWIFQHVSAVAHHGGAGTTAKVLAASLPSLVIPVLRWADQMQWGDMVQQQGIGIKIRAKHPSPAQLQAAVRAVMWDKDGIRRRADMAGARLRAERSTHVTGTLFESCLCNLLLPPTQAAALYSRPVPEGLSPVQRMCLRHCIPCNKRKWRVHDVLQPGAAVALGVKHPELWHTRGTPDDELAIPAPYGLLAQPLIEGGDSDDEEGGGDEHRGGVDLDALTTHDVHALSVFSTPAMLPHLARCAAGRIGSTAAAAGAGGDSTPEGQSSRRRRVQGSALRWGHEDSPATPPGTPPDSPPAPASKPRARSRHRSK